MAFSEEKVVGVWSKMLGTVTAAFLEVDVSGGRKLSKTESMSETYAFLYAMASSSACAYGDDSESDGRTIEHRAVGGWSAENH